MNDSVFLLFTELLLSSFDDVLARLLLGSASLVALSRDTLARTGMSASLTALTTAHRVVDRIHDNAAVARTTAEVTAAAGLTADFKVVLRIAHDTNSGTASLENHAHLAAGHLDDGILIVTAHQLGICTGRTHHLGTLARTKLDIVNQRAERNLSKQQGVSHLGSDTGTGHDGLADLQALGAEDVALLAVGIAHEGDTRTAVGIVLDGLHHSGDTILVTLEIDKTEQLFVSAADIAHRHLTLIVTATALTLAVDKALLRSGSSDVVVGDNQLVALTRSRRFNFL